MTKMPLLRTHLEPVWAEEQEGPYYIVESEYDNLWLLSQQFMTEKADRIKSIAEIITHLQADQPELGRPPVGFLDGYKPVNSYCMLIQFARGADRQIGTSVRGMDYCEVTHVLRRYKATRQTSTSRL